VFYSHGFGIIEFDVSSQVDLASLASFVDQCKKTCFSDFSIDKDGNFHHVFSKKVFNKKNHKPPQRFFFLEDKSKEVEQTLLVLQTVVHSCLATYVSQYPEVRTSLWWASPPSIAVYSEGCYMGTHHDNLLSAGSRSTCDAVGSQALRPLLNTLSCSFVLLDDAVGGDLGFTNLNKEFKIKPGNLFIYPSNFIGSHYVTPATSGERSVYLQFFGSGPIDDGGTVLNLT
jgi:hypothetical protein